MTCCFLGHKDAPSSIYPRLEEAIEKLIVEQNVSSFLFGNQGHFDGMSLKVVREMKIKYPHISYNVVLAYMPTEKDVLQTYEFDETILPEGIETVHPRYAISWRNKWMINESDFVLCYVTHSWGGAARYADYSQKKNKTVINIASRSL